MDTKTYVLLQEANGLSLRTLLVLQLHVNCHDKDSCEGTPSMKHTIAEMFVR